MSDTELRELDVWIAKHVMAWKECKLGNIGSSGWYAVQGSEILIHDRGNYVKPFHPTTDPADAMMVLEKCAEKGLLSISFQSGTKRVWRTDGKLIMSEGETLPLAICGFSKMLYFKQ